MLLIFKILTFVFLTILLLQEERIFIEQYYSIKRYLILGKERLKKYGYYLFIFLILIESAIVLDHTLVHGVAIGLMLVANLILYLTKKPQCIPLTRRSIFLFVMSEFLLGIIVFIPYVNYWIIFGYLFSAKFVSGILLCLSKIILSPLEGAIRSFYISKARKKLKRMQDAKIIGITGSYGKTSFKMDLLHILKTQYQVTFPKGSINTLMGLTQFINEEVSDTDDFVVVEIGIDEKNGMKKFHRLFKLDYAVITAIGPMHLATFKTLENVLKAKIKIQNLLKENGKIFFNGDDALLNAVEWNFPYESYSLQELNYEINNQLKCFLTLCDTKFEIKLLGDKQLLNLAGAIKLACHLKVSTNNLIKAVSRLNPSDRRQKIYHIHNKIVIDDSYNANYFGLLDSIELLKKCPGRKVIITGGLIEIGTKFEKYNYSIGTKLVGIDKVIILTRLNNHPLIKGYRETQGNMNSLFIKNDLQAALEILNDDDKNVLITAKGSDFYLK